MKKNTEKEPTSKRRNGFWIRYLIYCILLVLFWVLLVKHVQKGLVEYEAAQPYHLAEQVVQEVQAGNTELFAGVDWESTRFEPADVGQNAFLQSFAGKTISYVKDNGFYDTSSAAYTLYGDDEQIGTLILREVSTEPMLLLLSKGQWEVKEILPVYAFSEKAVRVTVPDSFQVYVNDIVLDERERVGEPIPMEQFGYSENYVKVPYLVEYQVSGLLHEPGIRICDAAGRDVEYSKEEQDGITEIYADTFAVSEPEEALAAMVLKNAEDYSNFFSKDLPGSNASVKPLKHMFPEDSYYLELAENYRREDMWMYNAHDTPVFSGEKVWNYIVYSEDLFSCEVYFEKTMHLIKYGGNRLDVTHSRFFYGKLDGEWKILDIQTVLE